MVGVRAMVGKEGRGNGLEKEIMVRKTPGPFFVGGLLFGGWILYYNITFGDDGEKVASV